MGCIHRKLEGNTTKFFVCGITGKSIDDYKCRDCMLKIEQKNDINDLFGQLFGKGFKN